MTQLDKIRALAQRDANRIGRPLAVLNLNPYSPLYVVREVPPEAQHDYLRRKGELVEIVAPQAA